MWEDNAEGTYLDIDTANLERRLISLLRPLYLVSRCAAVRLRAQPSARHSRASYRFVGTSYIVCGPAWAWDQIPGTVSFM